MGWVQKTVTIRNAIACGMAMLVLFVGIVHELVGSTLYPEGPSEFGGVFWWHAAGASLCILGGLLVLGTLGLLRLPVRAVAFGIAAAGLFIAMDDLLRSARFHLFAATLFLSGAGIGFLFRRGSPSQSGRGTAAL